MDPLNRILIHSKEFTETEKKIADKICDDPTDVIRDTIVTVSTKMKVSKSALLRFCQKIGYEGYSEFKYELTRFMNASEEEVSGNSYIKWIQDSLNDLDNKTLLKSVQEIATLILQSKKIRIFGINETGLSAKQLYYRLLSLGIDSTPIVESEIMHFYPNIGDEQDLHIFFSLSATTEVIKNTLIKSFDKKKKIILITQNTKCKYSDKVDVNIVLPTINPTDKRRFVDSQMINFVFIELLINTISNTLINKRKETV